MPNVVVIILIVQNSSCKQIIYKVFFYVKLKTTKCSLAMKTPGEIGHYFWPNPIGWGDFVCRNVIYLYFVWECTQLKEWDLLE